MTFSKSVPYEKISAVALAIAIVALPFSVAICHAGLILLSLTWLLEGGWSRKWATIKNNLLLWPFIFFFLLHLIGLFYSDDLTNGWFNVEKKVFFFLLPVILATTTIRSPYLNLLLKSFIFSSFIAVVVCLAAALIHVIQPSELPPIFDYSNFENYKLLNPGRSIWWSYFSYNALSSAIRIHPTYLGLYIVFSIALIFHFYKQEKVTSTWKKGMTAALLLLFSLFVLLLSSRAILIAYLLISFTGLIWISGDKIRSFTTLSAVGLISIGSLILVFVNPISRFRFIQEFKVSSLVIESGKLYTTSSSIRYSLWWLGMESITSRNWMTGNGTGDVIDTIKDTATKYGITNTINSYDPHNQFLYTFLALGTAGVLCLMACLFLPVCQSLIFGSFLHRCFIAIVVIACMTESLFELQKGIVFFSIFHSLLIFHLQPLRFTQFKLSHG